MSNAIKEMSLDSQLLRDQLLNVGVGETISYDDLTKAIGRDVRSRAKGALQTARNHALRNHKCVFQAVANVGLKRLSDEEIISAADGDIKHIRRSARKASMKITRVDFAALPNEAKIEHNAKLSVLGAINQFTAPTAIATLKAAVAESKNILPLTKTLDAFR